MKKALILTTLAFISFLTSCDKNNSGIDLNGVNFTKVTNVDSPGNNLEENIVSYNEILGYDTTNHIFLVSEDASTRIKNEKWPSIPSPFAIVVDGEVIYLAYFYPAYSSMSFYNSITVEPYSPDGKYRFDLGPDFSGIDPRNDSRIISRLQTDNKLFKIEF